MARLLRYPDYQIAANYNNADGLESFESLLPPGGGRYLLFPRARGGYTQGAIVVRGDGTNRYDGFPAQTMIVSAVTYAQAKLLQDDYCGGGYNGKVTIRTRLSPAHDYANYNAILTLPQPSEYDDQNGGIRDYTLTFTRMVAL